MGKNQRIMKEEVIINRKIIFPPIEACIEECINNKSIINFLSFIPSVSLYPYAYDILQTHILPNIHHSETNHLMIIIPPSYDYGLYISYDMYKSIYEHSLPKWINQYSVTKAKQIFEQQQQQKKQSKNTSSRNNKKYINDDDDDDSIHTM